jgi:hypothetical protein
MEASEARRLFAGPVVHAPRHTRFHRTCVGAKRVAYAGVGSISYARSAFDIVENAEMSTKAGLMTALRDAMSLVAELGALWRREAAKKPRVKWVEPPSERRVVRACAA